MAQPNLMPSPGKAVISPRAALIATIRTWFLYRDEALWAFVSGDEPDNPLPKIVIGDETNEHISEANAACERAWRIAQKIATENEQKASSVMRDAITELLASEQPRFLLPVSHIPGTF
jgi:hypothetical protein